MASGKHINEKFEFAVELIESINSKEKSPISLVESAQTILSYGNISMREFLGYQEVKSGTRAES